MIAAERQRKIEEYLEQNGSVRVSVVASMLSVTPETVRRDLEKLESMGRLVRQHGGAILNDAPQEDPPFIQRQIRFVEEKACIVGEAVKRLRRGDIMVIDGSTTSLQLAKALPDMKLTVITNSFHALSELAGKREIQTIALGGQLDPTSMCFLGPSVENQMRNYFVDLAFVSCRGVDLEAGVSDASEMQAAIKVIMLNQARRSYLLADHAKFGMRSLARFATVEQFNEVITDRGLDDENVEEFRQAGMSLYLA